MAHPSMVLRQTYCWFLIDRLMESQQQRVATMQQQQGEESEKQGRVAGLINAFKAAYVGPGQAGPGHLRTGGPRHARQVHHSIAWPDQYRSQTQTPVSALHRTQCKLSKYESNMSQICVIWVKYGLAGSPVCNHNIFQIESIKLTYVGYFGFDKALSRCRTFRSLTWKLICCLWLHVGTTTITPTSWTWPWRPLSRRCFVQRLLSFPAIAQAACHTSHLAVLLATSSCTSGIVNYILEAVHMKKCSTDQQENCQDDFTLIITKFIWSDLLYWVMNEHTYGLSVKSQERWLILQTEDLLRRGLRILCTKTWI